MPDRHPSGVLDTCTLAELHQGVALARDGVVRSARVEKLAAAISDFEPLPFDGDTAGRFGTLVALTRSAGRDYRQDCLATRWRPYRRPILGEEQP